MADPQQSANERQITDLFTRFSPRRLVTFLSERTDTLMQFGEEFVMICLNEISHNNPAHITNAAMNECLLHFNEWGQFISVGKRAMLCKMMHNAEVLAYQCQRFNWFDECGDDDPVKQAILEIVDEDEDGQEFVDFLQSM